MFVCVCVCVCVTRMCTCVYMCVCVTCANPMLRECPGGIVLFHNDERYCQISCSSSDKCGPVLIPEEHLKVRIC